jgi:hypothetical protein
MWFLILALPCTPRGKSTWTWCFDFKVALTPRDDGKSFETYIQIEGEEVTELELSTNELVDAALGINHAHRFDLNVDLHSIDVDHDHVAWTTLQ